MIALISKTLRKKVVSLSPGYEMGPVCTTPALSGSILNSIIGHQALLKAHPKRSTINPTRPIRASLPAYLFNLINAKAEQATRKEVSTALTYTLLSPSFVNEDPAGLQRSPTIRAKIRNVTAISTI
jgi:hypothetical protein